MERKRSLIVAGAVSGTLLAASTAYALTGGLLDRPADDGAGTLAPVTATVEEAPAAATTPAPRVRLSGDERAELHEVLEHAGEPGHGYEGADDDD